MDEQERYAQIPPTRTITTAITVAHAGAGCVERQWGHFVAPLSIHSLHFGHCFLLEFARRPVVGRRRNGLDLAGCDEALDSSSNGSGSGTSEASGTGGLGTVVTLPQDGHVSRWPTRESGEVIFAPHFGQTCSIITRPFSSTGPCEPYYRTNDPTAFTSRGKDAHPPGFSQVVIRLPQ